MIQVNQITPRYEEGVITSVNVYFTGKIGSLNFNGPITLTAAEFQSFLLPDAMSTAVRNKVIDEVVNGTGGEEPAQ